MENKPTEHRILILCATAYERKNLIKHGLEGFAEIRQTGPGASAVIRSLKSTFNNENYSTIIQTGLAGSLNPIHTTGSVVIASHILNEKTECWNPTWPSAREKQSTKISMGTILGADRLLATPSAKREANQRFRADIVDTESHGLATWASTCSDLSWGVIRGICDAADESLPDGVDQWIQPSGQLDPGQLTLSLLRHPWQINRICQLSKSSALAMKNVADCLLNVLS